MDLLQVRDLHIEYADGGRDIGAVEAASLSLTSGSAVGLVGESGSGKTTLALSLMGLLPANGRIASGQILYDGVDVAGYSERAWRRLRWTKVALVFQGGMNALNPVRRVIDQIVEPMLVHRTVADRSSAERRAVELLDRVGITNRQAHSYPHEYSGGMRQRACIAMALACGPELLIADEPTTAVDVVVQAQILRLLVDLRESLNLALLLITHDLGVVAQLCDDVLVMYAGKIVEHTSTVDLFDRPFHPYTQLLLKSVPTFVDRGEIGSGIPGQPPSLLDPPTGCRFHPRCPSVMPVCSGLAPALSTIAGHSVACYLYGR
jgi:peptide/nickel transport system ATP-binding protein